MAGSGRRGGGERVLESRHLVGLFLGVVLLCGVFFTLGYVMGHNQYGGSVHAAGDPGRSEPAVRTATKPAEREAAPASTPANNEWDFYSKNNSDGLEPSVKPEPPAAAPLPAVSAGKTAASPASPKVGGPAAPKVGPVAPIGDARTVPAAARFQPPSIAKGSVVLQIAALKHESDALAMADALQQKQFPAFVVTPSSDNLYRVQVGPYTDEPAAESARKALDLAGFKAILKR